MRTAQYVEMGVVESSTHSCIFPAPLQTGSQDLHLNIVYVPTNHVYVGDVFLMEDKEITYTNLSVREGLGESGWGKWGPGRARGGVAVLTVRGITSTKPVRMGGQGSSGEMTEALGSRIAAMCLEQSPGRPFAWCCPCGRGGSRYR